MDDDAKNLKRRDLLRSSTALVGGIGIGAFAIPLLSSLSPSARAKAQGADVEVDISKLAPGQLLIAKWRRMPVWILHRTPEMLRDMALNAGRLKDPESERETQQPDYARNPHRSIRPEILVVIGICTHLGCSPNFKPEHGIEEVGDWWKGGFFCPCHYSEYDLAGRVFKGRSPAPLNLPVPPHKYLSDTTILIGNDEKDT